MKTMTLKISKNFTVDEVAKFRETTYLAISKEQIHFDLDFSECTFIDSTGLGVLVGLFKKCQETKTEMQLFGLNEDVKRIIHMTRLDSVFDIRP